MWLIPIIHGHKSLLHRSSHVSCLSRTTYRRKYHLILHPHASVVAAVAAAAAAPSTARTPDRRKWLTSGAPSWEGKRRAHCLLFCTVSTISERTDFFCVNNKQQGLKLAAQGSNAIHLSCFLHGGICLSYLSSNRRHHINFWTFAFLENAYLSNPGSWFLHEKKTSFSLYCACIFHNTLD